MQMANPTEPMSNPKKQKIMKQKKYSDEVFEQRYKEYAKEQHRLADLLIAFAKGYTTVYPFQEVDNFLNKHAPADVLGRMIVIQGLAMLCITPCKLSQLAVIDRYLAAHARRELNQM